MTEELISFLLDVAELKTTATEKIRNLVAENRDDVCNPDTFKQAAEDLLSSYMAYSAVCCCVISGGDMEKWNHRQSTNGLDPELILCALNCLIGGDQQ